MSRKVKYMGASDERTISAGEDWGGRLANPIQTSLHFNRSNNRTVDVGEAGLSDAAIMLLLEDPLFVDVTDAEIIPAGLNEQYYSGTPETPFVSRSDGRGHEIYRSPTFDGPLDAHEDLTVEEMKSRAAQLGVSKSGTKAELAERLAKAENPDPTKVR